MKKQGLLGLIDLLSKFLCGAIGILIFRLSLHDFGHGSEIVSTIATWGTSVVQHIYLFFRID